MFIFGLFTPAAHAATADQQIVSLQQNNTQVEQQKQQLGAEAKTLSETIASLQAEIAAVEAQINTTKNKVQTLNQDIAKAEAELVRQRELLSVNVRTMYKENDTTSLEMLASSRNFSHFMDREQYRGDLQEKIDVTKNRIEKLTKQLAQEKNLAERLLTDQQAMQGHLNGRKAENDRLLNLNQEQQQAFQRTLDANNARIAKLRQQQAAENNEGAVNKPAKPAQLASVQAAHGSAYPWANAPFPNELPDPWGMYQRQCVSYTAWKVASSGRHMPYWGGRGNANEWDDNARQAGIPVDTNPRVGDIAVSNAGTYGHVMYVEAVHGDGTISISQYNAGWDGLYSEVRRDTAGLVFIHF